MESELLAAVREGRIWLDKFRRRTYDDAFLAYAERFGPAYTEAAQAVGAAGLRLLAEELLDGLEQGWKAQRPWNRAVAKAQDKQMLVDYLSPLLLELEEPGCPRLAELLRDGWAQRWPKDPYGIATYAQIRGGFRSAIMGFQMPDEGGEEAL